MDELPMLLNPLPVKEARLKNPLALAFIGDTVWDLLVRSRLLRSRERVGSLHRQAVAQVNAGAQAQAVSRLITHLCPEERAVLQRGRNAHAKHAAPKNQDPVDYGNATGLEALLGYLYLSGQWSRLLILFDIAMPMT